MKTLVLCSVIIMVQALTDKQLAILNNHKLKCLEDSKVDKDLVSKLKDGQFSVVNEPLKQYTLCIMKIIDLITDDGFFKKEVALSKVLVASDKPIVNKFIDECSPLQGSNLQDKAWNFATCYHQKNKKYSIFH